MSTVIRLGDYRRGATRVVFTRGELDTLLSLYAGRVAGGEWRDYAIVHERDQAMFCVFRATHDRPLYTITKVAASGRPHSYVVSDASQVLGRGRTLDEALALFTRRFRLV